MKVYETMAVVDGTLSEDDAAKKKDSIKEFFEKHSSLEGAEDWGKRKLAYEIAGKTSAYYYLFIHNSEPGVITNLNEMAKYDESILRAMTVIRDEKTQELLDERYRRKEEERQSRMAGTEGDEEEQSEAKERENPEDGPEDAPEKIEEGAAQEEDDDSGDTPEKETD